MRLALPVVLVALMVAVIWVVAPSSLPGHAQIANLVGMAYSSADGQGSQASLTDAAARPDAKVKRSSGDGARSTGALSEDRPLAAESSRATNPHGEGTSSDPRLRASDAGSTASNKTQSAQLLGCLIEPDRVAEVGTPVLGVVESIDVERGDRVKQGQVLARLRAEVERASVGVAHARAQAEADMRAALTNVEFLRQKQVRAEELVAKNFVSQQALEQARADTRVAEEKLAQAREQQSIWQRELELAHAQLQMRAIRAPFDGIVADRYVSVGERIEDKPMFRIVKVDPLRIEMVAPAALFGTVGVGAVASVTPELRNAPTLPAQVVLVDSLV
ncbi:MAG: efflux RND transporter periplasmic adaptor subunit, partial [Burkholderiales bacterium]